MEAADPAGPTPGASKKDPETPKERRYTTISIPQPLYEDIKRAIEGTGFRSPTEFLVYVARTALQSSIVGEGARTRGPPFLGESR